MARGNLVVDADALGRSAIRLYFRGGGVGVCETGVFERCLDMRPAWPAVLSELYSAEKILFESEGASGDPHDPNIPWKANKGSYGIWKGRYFSDRPNVLTGQLERQLTGEDAWNPPYIREGRTTFTFGSDAPTRSWSGRMVWYEDGELTDERERTISYDGDTDEDVGGIQAQGGWAFWGRGADDEDWQLAGPTHARPPISLGIEAIDGITEAVLDHITLAPVVGGWYNPGRRAWVPGLRRAGGGPLVANAGRVYRTGRTGRQRRVGEIEPT